MEKMYEIFKKNKLTDYQKRINDEAGKIAMNHPELLAKRGELLEKARANVRESGYDYKKGKSRSKNQKEVDHEILNVSPKRSKIIAELRQKRMKELQDEISILDEQIKFKVMRRKECELKKQYRACEEITAKILSVTHQQNEKNRELTYLSKEKKSLWYKDRKEKRRNTCSTSTDSTVSCTSEDSDIPVFISPPVDPPNESEDHF